MVTSVCLGKKKKKNLRADTSGVTNIKHSYTTTMDQNITNPDSYDSYNLTQTPTSYPILNSPTSTNKATLQQSSSSSSTISELSKTDRLIIRHTGIYKNFSSHVRDGTSMAEFLLDDLKSPIFFFKRFWPSFRTTFAKNRIERYYKKYGRNFAKGELSSEFFTGFFFSVLTSAITPKYIRKVSLSQSPP